jgi:GntR family transcriptional regulator
MRSYRYIEIADTLRSQLDNGDLVPGELLPSEAALSTTHAVSRMTLRKALDALRAEGLLDSRQGVGWFVKAEPVRQPLARLDTIEEQLERLGIESQRRVLDFAFVKAPSEVAAVLGVDRVLEVRRVNLADDQPFARVTVWCSEALGSALSRDEVESSPFYELVGATIGGAHQDIGADACSPADSQVLDIPADSPVLVCRRTTHDTDGTPVLYSEHVFPAHRTEFRVDLPHAPASIAPSGLQLVRDA